MMLVAIDPGVEGAAAAISGHDFIDVIDLPTVKHGKRREIDGWKIAQWLMHMMPRRIVMESAHSRPTDGVASAFHFGVAVGMMKAACQVKLNVELEYVEPVVWKGYFDLIGKDKEASRLRALQIFPEACDFLERKKDHNRAEAMLIAWWAARPPVGRNW